MIFPDIINYLLTLKYPGSESARTNWVCYRGVIQTIMPLMPPNTTVNFTIQPLQGVYAWLGWASRPGTDLVPNVFSGSIQQYGSFVWAGVVTQRGMNDPAEYFALVTEQEPAHLSLTNISPLAQRWETIFDFLVISSQQDLNTIMDALRRLHTSQVSEELLQQAVNLLGVLSGQPQAPRPPLGRSV